ncbi:MAG: response regulator [Longimicrobiales bacterium]
MMDSNAVEVLLVEDNAVDAEQTLRALRGKGLRNPLVVVEDGVEALDFLFARGAWSQRDIAGGPRMVLLDLRLPRLDGLEVLRQVKADERTRSIPVVILTSSRQDPDVQRCRELGADSYIVKPVDFDKFTRSVAEIGYYWLLLNEPPRSGR